MVISLLLTKSRGQGTSILHIYILHMTPLCVLYVRSVSVVSKKICVRSLNIVYICFVINLWCIVVNQILHLHMMEYRDDVTAQLTSLTDVVKAVKPTCLFGLSTTPGTFTEEV